MSESISETVKRKERENKRKESENTSENEVETIKNESDALSEEQNKESETSISLSEKKENSLSEEESETKRNDVIEGEQEKAKNVSEKKAKFKKYKTKEEEMRELARILLAKGVPWEEVAERTSLPKRQIWAQKGWLSSPSGRLWFKKRIKEGVLTIEDYERIYSKKKEEKKQVKEEKVEEKRETESIEKSKLHGLVLEGEKMMEVEPKVYDLEDREVVLTATEIARRVVLNPKVLLFYDFLCSRYGYEGTLADFILDCVEDFLNSRNIKIAVIVPGGNKNE